jgi:hypothetical protein
MPPDPLRICQRALFLPKELSHTSPNRLQRPRQTRRKSPQARRTHHRDANPSLPLHQFRHQTRSHALHNSKRIHQIRKHGAKVQVSGRERTIRTLLILVRKRKQLPKISIPFRSERCSRCEQKARKGKPMPKSYACAPSPWKLSTKASSSSTMS